MKIKVYAGCAVDNHWGIYAAQRFAQLHSELLTEYEREILNEPGSEEYCEVAGNIFPRTADNLIYDFNECGDILAWELIDSGKITVEQLNKYANNENFGKYPVYECSYGYADIAQIGENCLCRVSIANVGIIGADCFFEMDECFSFDENLSTFCDELQETLKHEFEKDYDIFILPAHFASALVNADESGLNKEESRLLNKFVRENCSGLCVGCSDDQFFTDYHDMPGIGAADCLEYYFERSNK